uniref:Transposase-associated domain-containing protein n=1 Tax=Ananas comosus var. bracteatus TaxID=296719 RepID=A0A6V7PED4_ANACO|nr:unnamed protein product [Ananas comosus var. bracteatus]
MDKSWIHKSRLSKEYFDGVNDFLNFAFERSSQDEKILCPCLRCSNINWHTREVVKEHLVCNGFLRGYTRWACHGESISPLPPVAIQRTIYKILTTARVNS